MSIGVTLRGSGGGGSGFTLSDGLGQPLGPEQGFEQGMASPPQGELALGVEVWWRHPVVEAKTAPGIDQIEFGQGFETTKQGVGHLPDLGAQPPKDTADLLVFFRLQERKLSRLLGDRLRLDKDGFVAGAGPVD